MIQINRAVFVIAFTLLLFGVSRDWLPLVLHAQAGMSKATAKLLVSDLIEAGFAPQIQESGGVYTIVVTADRQQAGTAAQVQAFANARGVTARVLAVQFE